MDRNLALEFVRVTEAAAIAASDWFGRGDKEAADGAAVAEMRARFNTIAFAGTVVIGEGEKDEAPMLHTGERLGTGDGPTFDVAVDPLEGTTNCAAGRPNAISVLAAGEKLLSVPGTYMEQLAVGPAARDVIDLERPVAWNLQRIAAALDKPVGELVVALLDRPRHEKLLAEIRALGARAWLFDHGTISAGIATAQPESGIDVMMGVGGAPEAVITAAALRCYGGDFQARLKPHNEQSRADAVALGVHEGVYTIDELAGGDVLFAATGVSDGPLLRGVLHTPTTIITHSLVMRSKSGTVRYLETHHRERRGETEEKKEGK